MVRKATANFGNPKKGKMPLMFACTFALLFYLIFRGHDFARTPSQAPPRAAASEQKVRSVNAPVVAEPVELKKAQNRELLLIKNNVASGSPALVDNKIDVRVKLNPMTRRCKPGDFDLILKIATDRSAPMFTLSLESLNKKDVKVAKLISASDMLKGAVVTLPLPLDDDAYSLAICVDTDKTRACSSKRPVDQTIWTETFAGIRAKSQNAVLYYQMALVRNKTLLIIPSIRWGQENIEELTKNIGEILGNDAKHMETMNRFIAVLRPLSASYVDRQISVPLPYSDNKCVG
ncbi:MAG: hypothetical protein H7249_09280 [Chitinophagaceae bacterium]|nr:hypothetical protein [Oligoflexus sp.]